MGMAVQIRGFPMGRPSGVPDATVPVHRVLLHQQVKVGKSSLDLSDHHLLLC
ncbi:hypothetical protein SDC9_130544 [bioreactor metagenome]|uniref:Uncharacterized protein n=1 Tax=bioreactor metagenome TaxID=1076179 RepID=A0A645D1Y4_9ZZZZ